MEHPVLANFGDVDIGPGRVDDDVFGLGVEAARALPSLAPA
jgi:hypothetical protein